MSHHYRLIPGFMIIVFICHGARGFAAETCSADKAYAAIAAFDKFIEERNVTATKNQEINEGNWKSTDRPTILRLISEDTSLPKQTIESVLNDIQTSKNAIADKAFESFEQNQKVTAQMDHLLNDNMVLEQNLKKAYEVAQDEIKNSAISEDPLSRDKALRAVQEAVPVFELKVAASAKKMLEQLKQKCFANSFSFKTAIQGKQFELSNCINSKTSSAKDDMTWVAPRKSGECRHIVYCTSEAEGGFKAPPSTWVFDCRQGAGKKCPEVADCANEAPKTKTSVRNLDKNGNTVETDRGAQ